MWTLYISILNLSFIYYLICYLISPPLHSLQLHSHLLFLWQHFLYYFSTKLKNKTSDTVLVYKAQILTSAQQQHKLLPNSFLILYKNIFFMTKDFILLWFTILMDFRHHCHQVTTTSLLETWWQLCQKFIDIS